MNRVNADVAIYPGGDTGHYDAARQFVYLSDYNAAGDSYGYAMGLTLLKGAWRGYGITNIGSVTTSDAAIKQNLITPSNTIAPDGNLYVWIVADLPDLAMGEDTLLVFGLCGNTTQGDIEGRG